MELAIEPKVGSIIRPLESIPPVLSFFSGGGFLDLGFMQAGFNTVWSQEIDAKFGYAHDYGMEKYFGNNSMCGMAPVITSHEDIRDTGPTYIRRKALGTIGKGDYFGVIGGPPCPDFSVGGKNKGIEGDRGKLTEVFVQRILELKPSFFVIENVKGLISTRRHREFIDGQIWKLQEKGYAVDIKILNALDFGIPQDRERVFVVGVLRTLIRNLYSCNLSKDRRNWYPWPVDKEFIGAKAQYDWPSTTPFGGIPSKPKGIPEQLFAGPQILDQTELSKLPNGQEWFRPYSHKFSEIPEGDDSRKSFKRLHRYRYSPTAAYGNNEVHLHPTLPRRLSVREVLRIQSVPDEFALPSELPLSTKFKLVGNGVPVTLAKRVGESLVSFLMGSSGLLRNV